MKQHPVRSAFEHLDDRASSNFREALRARLLSDLVAPITTEVGPHQLTDRAQETIVTYGSDHSLANKPGRRVLLGIAAATIVAVGVSALVINRNNADPGNAASESAMDSGDIPSSQPVTVTGEALSQFDPTAAVDPEVGQPAPLISGFDFQGNPIAVDPAAKGPYMIVFLAHWCPHCNAELPRLLDWKASGAVPTELNVVGVSTAVSPTAPNYPPSEWFAAIDKEWSWPLMVDESQGDGKAGKAASAYGPIGWPYFVIVGADGLVKARVTGEIEVSELQAIVNDALAA